MSKYNLEIAFIGGTTMTFQANNSKQALESINERIQNSGTVVIDTNSILDGLVINCNHVIYAKII